MKLWPFGKSTQKEAPAPERKAPTLRPVYVQAARNWPAAQVSDLTADWPTTASTMWTLLNSNLRILRARSRAEYHANDYAKRFINILRQNIVGPDGFALQALFVNGDGSPDQMARQAFEQRWKDWKRPENCHSRGRLSWNEICRLAIETLAKDGEFILRRKRGGPLGVQVDLIDPELLDMTYNEHLPTGNVISFGVELTPSGRPVAYHFATPQETHNSTGKRIKISAAEIFHGFVYEAADQIRGVPWLATPAMRLHMLKGFEEAAVINARAGASKMGFTKGYEDEDEETNSSGNPITEATPGHWERVPDDFELVEYSPEYPRGEFDPFVMRVLKGAAAGFNVPYHQLSGDLADVNFATGKIGNVDAQDWYMTVQNWFAEHVLDPFWPTWVNDQLMGPGIEIGNGQASPKRIEKYYPVRWQGRRWTSVEPLKDAQTREKDLANNLTTRRRIWLSQGLDPDEMVQELIDEKALFEQEGLKHEQAAQSTEEPIVEEDENGNPRPGSDDEGAGLPDEKKGRYAAGPTLVR